MTLTGFASRLPSATFTLANPLPPCTWCGDTGAVRMTREVVLCAADYEYVELHRSTLTGAW